MRDWTDDDPDVNRILEAIQPMEEIGGPELETYIAILEHIQADIQQRLNNARKTLKDDFNEGDKFHRLLEDPMGDGPEPKVWP